MIPSNFRPEWIRRLNVVGRELRNHDIHIPTEQEVLQSKTIIENILPPSCGEVTRQYAKNVLIGYEHAKIHYRSDGVSMLDDIMDGQDIDDRDISKYDLCKVDFL